jgi:hypothetical protein
MKCSSVFITEAMRYFKKRLFVHLLFEKKLTKRSNAPGRKYVLAVWQLEKKFIQVSLQKGLKGNNLDPRIGLLHGPMYK